LRQRSDGTQYRRREIDHHVDAAVVGPALRLAVFLDRPFGEIDLAIVDDLIGPSSRRRRAFCVPLVHAMTSAPSKLRQNDAAGAHAPAGAEDQHALAGFHSRMGDQHPMCGAVGDR